MLGKATLSIFTRYGLVFFAVILAVVFDSLLVSIIGEEGRSFLFFALVLASAWYGGPGPGMFSAVLYASIVEFLFPNPRLELSLTGAELGHASRLALLLSEAAVICWFTTASRATSQRQRSDSVDLRQLAEAMPQIVWTASPAGRTTFISSQWSRYTSLPAEPAHDPQFLAEAIHPDDRVALHERWKLAVAAGTTYEFEFRLKRAGDGAYRWFVSHAVPVKDEAGRVVYWFGTSTDIHDQKHTEELLKTANRHKNEFLAMLSHELRNPLAPVRNAIHIMRMAQLDDPALVEARDIMDRQIGRMAGIIEDLIDIFRIINHELVLRKEPVDLAKLLCQTVEDERSPLENQRLTVTLEAPAVPVWILGDRTRLSQVLINLLHNAAKFTNAGDRVFVRLWLDADTQQATISIRDTGSGIPADILPHVFDIFTQAEQSLDRRRGGLGLGLALAKGLVELHSGEIHAASPGPGRGSEFTLRLPLSEQPQRDPERAPRTARSVKQLRILIVEDNPDTAKTLGLLLKRYGHEVATAHSGTTGVQVAKQLRPDIVLCDLGLPEMDGYEVAILLRQDPAMATARLIAVSGYGRDEDRRRSKAAGFDLHLTKPVDPAELQRLLETVR